MRCSWDEMGWGHVLVVCPGELPQLVLLALVWELQLHSAPWDGRYQSCHHSTEGCQMCTAQLGMVLGGA